MGELDRRDYSDIVKLIDEVKESVENGRDSYVEVLQVIAGMQASAMERGQQVAEVFRLLRDHVATKDDIDRMLAELKNHGKDDDTRFEATRRDFAATMKILRGDEETEGVVQRLRSVERDKALVRKSLWLILGAAVGAPAFFAGCIEMYNFWRGH